MVRALNIIGNTQKDDMHYFADGGTRVKGLWPWHTIPFGIWAILHAQQEQGNFNLSARSRVASRDATLYSEYT